jgi:hypothetical protein
MEPSSNELVEQRFQGGNHPVKARTDQDPDAADHGHAMRRRQHAYRIIIGKECGMLLDRERHHHHINGGHGWNPG